MPLGASGDVGVSVGPDKIEVWNSLHKFLFSRHGEGEPFLLSTFVKCGDSWEPFLDEENFLVSGRSFNLAPAECDVIANNGSYAAILLKGIVKNATSTDGSPFDYFWDALVDTRSDTPWIRVKVTVHLPSDLNMLEPEPNAVLWTRRAFSGVSIDQGPLSVVNTWDNGLPAAYLWDDGKEAVIFFNMTAMNWMSANNMRRFYNYHVATVSRLDATGLGLHAVSQNGNVIPKGDIAIEYFLYEKCQPKKPSDLEALDTMINICLPLLPSTAPWPKCATSWEDWAEKIIQEVISGRDICWTDTTYQIKHHGLVEMRVISDYVVNSSDLPQFRRSKVTDVWDFATTNNIITPWLIYLRLKPDQDQKEFVNVLIRCLPLYYDPDTNLIRYRPPIPQLFGPLDMSWENFLFHLEAANVHYTLPSDSFNPAIGGLFLKSCRSLIELAHNVEYVFPMFFDASSKIEAQHPDANLGKVREPFQAGLYSYLMLIAYRMTGDDVYLDEAKAALDRLFNMTYTEDNNIVGRRTYTNPAEFPVTELGGNSYGAAAAQLIYNLTGEEKYVDYSRHLINTLLEMAYWYDDETEPATRSYNNLGMFRPCGGQMYPAPWENYLATLPLTLVFKYRKPAEPILRILNLQRINSFYFSPICTPTEFQTKASLESPTKYIMYENLRLLEGVWPHGGLGKCIYMTHAALWYYLMFEALANTEDKEIMVLNLDLLDNLEGALKSIERSFIVYNPTSTPKDATVKIRHLATGNYTVTCETQDGKRTTQTLKKEHLEDGVAIRLEPLEYVTLQILNVQAETMKTSLSQMEKAKNTVAQAYSEIEALKTVTITSPDASNLKQKAVEKYELALQEYGGGQYENAAKHAQQAIETVRKAYEVELQQRYNELEKMYEKLRILVYVFIITTAVFMATTIYFAKRRSKTAKSRSCLTP